MANPDQKMWVSYMHQAFSKSSNTLTEEDSNFAPAPEMLTVAQQVAHVAHTIHWFIDGAFEGNWDMDFEAAIAEYRKATSLTEQREKLAAAFARLEALVDSYTPEQLQTEKIGPGPIMAGAPKVAALSSIDEHTAHHRGALTVYARMLGKVPEMPYPDM